MEGFAVKTAASTPASVVYSWYGRQVTVDMNACHQAMCRTVLDLDLAGMPATDAFAIKICKLHPETVRRFFRGKRPVGPTTVNMILKGLGLKADQVLVYAA
jgi:hypothetical protein